MRGGVRRGTAATHVTLLLLIALTLPTLHGVGVTGPDPGIQARLSLHAIAVTPSSSSGGGGGAPGPVITAFTATPTRVTIPGTIVFRVNATGGTPPLAYAYTGLPTGCTSQNAASFGCSPSAASSTNVTVTVRDASGQEAQAAVPVVVVPAPLGPMLFGLPAWEASTLLAVVAGVLAGLLLWRLGRRRPRATGAPPRADPSEPKTPS